MTPALPMIVPQPITNLSIGKPRGQKAPLQPKEVWARKCLGYLTPIQALFHELGRDVRLRFA